MPTVTKDIGPGEWQVPVTNLYEVTGASLRTARGRKYPLNELTRDDFHSRLMKRANGTPVEAAVLRGFPSFYIQEGNKLWMWPSPAHSWIIEISVRPKSKIKEAEPRVTGL